MRPHGPMKTQGKRAMELLANPEKRPPNFRQPTGGLFHPYPSKGFPHLDGGTLPTPEPESLSLQA
jgi:hypothetical protein